MQANVPSHIPLAGGENVGKRLSTPGGNRYETVPLLEET